MTFCCRFRVLVSRGVAKEDPVPFAEASAAVCGRLEPSALGSFQQRAYHARAPTSLELAWLVAWAPLIHQYGVMR